MDITHNVVDRGVWWWVVDENWSVGNWGVNITKLLLLPIQRYRLPYSLQLDNALPHLNLSAQENNN